MKVNLCYLKLEEKDGYINLSPFAQPNSPFQPCDIRNLDEVVCDDEAEEIVALDILNYFKLEDVLKCLQNWINKLKKGGRLLVTFDDAWEVSRRLFIGTIEKEQANEILYGKQEKPHQIKRSAIPMHWLKDWLASRNTKLIKCRLEGYTVVMEVEKL